jgi:hypothetical protein
MLLCFLLRIFVSILLTKFLGYLFFMKVEYRYLRSVCLACSVKKPKKLWYTYAWDLLFLVSLLKQSCRI